MSYDLPPCPSDECPWCNGSVRRYCHSGDGTWDKATCDHPAEQRHRFAPTPPEEVNRSPQALATLLELAALCAEPPRIGWSVSELFDMARRYDGGDYTDAELRAGLEASTLWVEGDRVRL